MKRPRGGPPSLVRVTCAAKVNLGWRVGALRQDGFHEVSGVLHTVSLVDRLEIRCEQDEPVAGDVVIDIDGVPVGLVVDGPEADDDLRTPSNLVFVAARLVGRARPTTIRLTKEIPCAAGLGGGSADAAGALVGLGLAWGARLGPKDLSAKAASVGSDVPAIVLGGLVHASGRGERVRAIGSLDPTAFVLGMSEHALETSAVYRRLDELRSNGRQPDQGCLSNDLEPAAVSLVPELADAVDIMRTAGASAAFLAGSGPTVVGVAAGATEASRIARRVRSKFRRVEVCAAVSAGVVVGVGSHGPPPA